MYLNIFYIDKPFQDKWRVMVNSSIELVWNVFTSLFILGSASLFIMISYRGFKERNLHSGFSTLATALLITSFGIYEIIVGLFPWPFGPHFLIFSLVIVGIQTLFLFIRKKNIQKDTNDPSSYNGISNGDFSFKHELIRKLFHLAGILVPLGYYWIIQLINQLIIKIIETPGGQVFYEFFWGSISTYPYLLDDLNSSGEFLYFILWCALIFTVIFDFVRIYTKPQYSIFRVLLRTVLREKELISVGPQVLLVLGATVSFFGATLGWYSYEIAVSAVFTACISDGFVAVLGKRFGKHKVRMFNGEEKSIEGFVIGFIVTYLCSMIILGPFYALFAAIIFVLLDVFPIPIADNLLNPIFLTLGVWVMSLIFNIPIGWGF